MVTWKSEIFPISAFLKAAEAIHFCEELLKQ